MSESKIACLEDAKKQLNKLMESLSKPYREHLLSYAIEEWMTIKIGDDDSDDDCNEENDELLDDPVVMLNAIAKEIRQKVPFDAILPSEKIEAPAKGQNSDCDPSITVHVDGFLYNDDDVEDLVKEGKLQRYYCKDCRSKNVDSLIFISHSVSREQCYHIFNTLLPTLDNKIVLDVGSRLGAVLYGAYAYTDAKRIIGVEMNNDFCQLQEEVIRKFKLDKRIEIINSRIEEAVDVLRVSDVVILNNVFEFYLSEREETEVWNFLKKNIKKGAFIVSIPSINVSLSRLNTGIDTDKWLKLIEPLEQRKNLFDLKIEDGEDFSEIFCYIVL